MPLQSQPGLVPDQFAPPAHALAKPQETLLFPEGGLELSQTYSGSQVYDHLESEASPLAPVIERLQVGQPAINNQAMAETSSGEPGRINTATILQLKLARSIDVAYRLLRAEGRTADESLAMIKAHIEERDRHVHAAHSEFLDLQGYNSAYSEQHFKDQAMQTMPQGRLLRLREEREGDRERRRARVQHSKLVMKRLKFEWLSARAISQRLSSAIEFSDK